GHYGKNFEAPGIEDVTIHNYESSPFKEQIQNACKNKAGNIDMDNFIAAVTFYAIPDTINNIFSNSMVECVLSDKPIVDISALYKTVGNQEMTFADYKRIDHALNTAFTGNSNAQTIGKFIGENFPSYDVDKSIFYMSVLFKTYFRQRKHLMNTNIKSLYEFCDRIAGFHNNNIAMMKNIIDAGYKMKIPASFIYQFSNVSRYIAGYKNDLKNQGFQSYIKVDILEELKAHIDFDIEPGEKNEEMN